MENKIKEEWKDVVGYEGIYQVSNYGNVKSLARKICHGKLCFISKEKSIKLCLRGGYKTMCLRKNNFKKMIGVHRLVAMAFIPNPENKPFVDHIDGDRTNNAVRNLRWCTSKENMNNEVTFPRNRDALQKAWNKRSRRVYQYNLNGEFIQEWTNARQASKATGAIQQSIKYCCENKYRSANGFRWSYDKKDNIGKLPMPYQCVRVAKMDMNGNVLGCYDSLKDAALSTEKCSIQDVSNCIRGYRKSSYGYTFKKI